MPDSAAASSRSRRSPVAGRKRTFDEDAVLIQAVDIFWQHGFAETTIRQLETELGLTASSIYNTFGSKNDLLDSAIERYLALMDRMVLAELRHSDDPLTGLQDFFHRISIGVDGEHRWGCFVVSLLTENAGRNPEITSHTNRYFDTLRTDFEAALQRAHEAELLNPEVYGSNFEAWISHQVDLLLANVLGINTAARGRMTEAVVDSMTAAVQMQIEGWRSG